jgi:hypothetical protein
MSDEPQRLPPPPPATAPAFGPPPSGPAYGTAPLPQGIGRLAKAIVTLLSLYVASIVVGTALSVLSRDDARDFAAGLTDEDTFLEAIAPSVLFDTVSGALSIALAVVVIIWLYRVASNQRHLTGTRWSPGWAIGGWFCPPVLFVIPLLVLRELWRSITPQSKPTVLWIWWVTYGLVPALLIPFGVSSALNGLNADTADLARSIDEQFLSKMASNIASVIAAACFIVVVRSLTSAQQRRTGGS